MDANNRKLKLLYIMQMLYEQTDEEHGITMSAIIEQIAEHGIDAERKSVYRDIAALNSFGLDVRKLPTRPTTYALTSRPFSSEELMLLNDAVQSSRFLTQRMADKLTGGIAKLGSTYQSRSLAKHIHVDGRIKMQNDSVFNYVHAIQDAISRKRQISFRYAKYDANKHLEPRSDGRFYQETPVHLMYSEGYYYLIAYNEKHESFPTYRIDRMQSLSITEVPSLRNEAIANFDAGEYSSRTFSMFGGETTSVVLLAKEELTSSLIDRFGKDIAAAPAEEGFVRAHVVVHASPTFFGWLAQFGTDMQIEAPRSLAETYAAYLEDIAASYRA